MVWLKVGKELGKAALKTKTGKDALKHMSFLGRRFLKKVQKGMKPSKIKEEKKFYEWADNPKNAWEIKKINNFLKNKKRVKK